MDGTPSVDKLVDVYIKIRDAKDAAKKAYEEKNAELTEQLDVIESEILEICKATGAESIKTQHGLAMRSIKTRYWTNDWEKFYKFMMEHNLPELLERRIDNVVYRLGLAPSRAQARQLVRHGHIILNTRKVDIPSLSVKAGDVIKVKEGISGKIRANLEKAEERKPPEWLSLDAASLEGKVESIPKRQDIGEPITESMIVEFYSR